MAIKVVLTNSSRVTKRTPELESDNNLDVRISRSTYQKLGSLIKNQNILEQYNNGELVGEYKRLLDDLNDLHLVKNYPDLAVDVVLSEGIEELDEYLGSLGIDIEYSYDKDTVDIGSWLSLEGRTDTRVLMDFSDNTYLTDSSGTEVLVRY